MPWVLLTCSLLSVILTGASICYCWLVLWPRLRRQVAAEMATVEAWNADLVVRLDALQGEWTALRLQMEADKARAAEEARQYPVGMFVPTDEAAREIEDLSRVADDHFILAHGPTRLSSRPSRRSGARLDPARSTPPRRSSGTG